MIPITTNHTDTDIPQIPHTVTITDTDSWRLLHTVNSFYTDSGYGYIGSYEVSEIQKEQSELRLIKALGGL